MSRRIVLLSLVAVLVSCGSEEPAGPERLADAPAPRADQVEVVSPIYEVPASDEVFMCFTVPVGNAETLLIKESRAYQSANGHHVLMLMVNEDAAIDPLPHVCTPADMAVDSLRFVGAGTAAGGGITLPEGIAIQIPPGRRLLLQSHYVNTSPTPLRVQDIVHLTKADPTTVRQIAGAYSLVDQTLELAPRGETTRVTDCSPPETMTVPWMFAHMHEWGVHAKIEVTRAGVTETVYDEAWDPAFRDHFPLVNFDPPLELGPTDRIKVTCQWANDTDAPIIFPTEMCAVFMPFYPAEGEFWICDQTGENYPL